MRAVRIEEFGGPEVLEVVDDAPEPDATEGQVRISVNRAGVNYADTHQAENSYLAPQQLPLVPGSEAAGTTADGRRVVALTQSGSYAEVAVADEAAVFALPDEVDDGEALALVLQGLTAWHLLQTSAKLEPGESVVVHAAAGGVGTVAVQLAKHFGAGRVIGAASSDDKRELVRELGADTTIDSRAEDLEDAIRDANGGKPVDVVLEMVGGDTTAQSMAALAPFGRLVYFGMASREWPDPVDPVSLMSTSRGIIGFWLMHCFRDPERLLQAPMRQLLELTVSGDLAPVVGAAYPLSDAEQAHRDMRERRTIGKVLLDPGA